MTALLTDPNVVALAIAIVVVFDGLVVVLLLTTEPTAASRLERAAEAERARTDAMHHLLDRLDYDHRTPLPPESARQLATHRSHRKA